MQTTHNKAPKFAPFAALTPRDADKARRPLARRYMYQAFLIAIGLFLFSSSNASEEKVEYVCGFDYRELNFAASIWHGFRDLEHSYSIVAGEAVAIEYSVSEYCQSEDYEKIGVFYNGVDGKHNQLLRSANVNDNCTHISISELGLNSPLEFSSKFKRRIYASRIDGLATVWFTMKDKGTFKFNNSVEKCVEENI